MDRRCNNCGAAVTETARCCLACGAILEETDTGNAVFSVQPYDKSEEQIEKKTALWQVMLFQFALLIPVIGLVLGWIFGASDRVTDCIQKLAVARVIWTIIIFGALSVFFIVYDLWLQDLGILDDLIYRIQLHMNLFF